MATLLSVIGVVLGLGLLVYASVKRINVYLVSVVSVAIIALFSGLSLNEAYSQIYSPTIGGFITGWLLIICLGGVMGSLYEKSGAIWRICDVCMRFAKTPTSALLLYMAVAFIMTYGGINVIVVAIVLYPLAKTLFPKAGIPWYMYPAIVGFSTVTYAMSMIPGSLQLQNILPTTYLGTTPSAGAVPGMVAGIFCIVLGTLYLRTMILRGVGTPEADISNYNVEIVEMDEEKLKKTAPQFVICLIPILATVIMVNIVKLPLVIGMLVGSLLALICFWTSVKEDAWNTLSKGIMSGVTPTLLISAVAAVGSVISKTPAFDLVYNAVINVQLPPIWKVIVVSTATTAMNASGTAGITMTLNLFANDFLSWGLPAGIIHRVIAICGVTLDSLPWNGYVVMLLSMAGVDFKKGYKHLAAMTILLPLICLIPCVIAYYLG